MPAEEEDPPRQGIETGEGDVTGPDEQRQHVVHEGGADTGITKRKIIVVPCMVNRAL